jgi:hypothetical protein
LKLKGSSRKKETKDGEIIKQFRKAWERNEKDGLTIMMEEISKHGETSASEITTNVEPETESAE